MPMIRSNATILTASAKDAGGIKLVNNIQFAAGSFLFLRLTMSALSVTPPSFTFLFLLVRHGLLLCIHC
jgi:hypothetical protein